MKSNNLKGNIILMITALIWGGAFVAQSVGMDFVGPFTFITARYIIGGIFLIPCIYLLKKIDKNHKNNIINKKDTIVGGILCGVVLFVSSSFQQVGMLYTTVGKSGFVTALYIIIVPILGVLFKKSISKNIWISAIIALIGMYLLCINENFALGIGDVLTLICAFCFSVHILIIDKFSRISDSVVMSCIQFFVAGILGIIPMLLFENVQVSSLVQAMSPILYAGIMSSGVAYTLQIIGQKYTTPMLATLIMSLESVFAVLSGWIILGEILSSKEFMGCALVFTAIIIAQLPRREKVIDNKSSAF